MKSLLTFFLLAVALFNISAQEPDCSLGRPVSGTYYLETGHRSTLATYLSPLRYSGSSFTLGGKWGKAMPFAPEKAVMDFSGRLSFSSQLNPAQTARMTGLEAQFSWAVSRRIKLPGGIQASAGAGIDILAGAEYLMRNGNNPVEAIANASVVLRGALTRPFRIGRFDFLLSDEMWLPATGAFFSPQFGETYYEIYLGNHSGLVHAGWWGNNFRIDNMLGVTLDFGRTAMTIGYRYTAYTQYACMLNTKIHTHAVSIGVVPGGIGLKRKSNKIYSSWL